MRKYAFITLLLAFLLVAMPVVAVDLGSTNDQELRLAVTETKLNFMKEEVAITHNIFEDTIVVVVSRPSVYNEDGTFNGEMIVDFSAETPIQMTVTPSIKINRNAVSDIIIPAQEEITLTERLLNAVMS